ncbi:Mobile element protein [Granulicella sibirica]|uniref:Mobile element protein n=3 Tax=Granulicella TaxID=940557 RepID=A0A4Q0SVZ5_9BACT|nr:Mobile element protein [Granulicella sibirica]
MASRPAPGKSGRSQPVDATPSDLDHFSEVVLMRRGRQFGLSAEQKAEIWRRWKAGDSLHEIGRAFDKDHGSIQFLLSKHGGIAPAVRRRSQRTLTLAEREEISRGMASGSSIREIARGLERPASTVSREVARHGGRLMYRASEADQRAWDSALRPKSCWLAHHRKLSLAVASKLILDWSPEQIPGWLKRRYPNNESMRVSHETIYRSLFIQARGVLKKELMQHLRSRRQIRRSVHAKAAGQSRGQIVDAISIRERPAEIEDRAIPGHWEGDLLSGSGNSHIATLVERHSRFTILVKVSSKDTATVVAVLTRQVRKLPASLRRSLTWDRGLEMAKHKTFTVATKVNVYFCDPQSPWQRGTNENTNGLLRQYFPRKTDLSGYSQADLNKVALRLNQRPRKTLDFETPASKLHASVASTG